MNREIKAVIEAMAKAYIGADELGRCYPAEHYIELANATLGSAELEAMAVAAISHSDSQYVKGLVEALRDMKWIDEALQQLPEDLIK